ncbi:hypothetical protein [Streptomyces sp. NPDC001401]|uniref:hypothetical protein n=1 Tax=Streptomyces sp. NPDC001401 TaxID=3364570 RepID=UPI0036AE8FEE
MANPARAFIHELSGLWGKGYWVTWHPSARHVLGEIGTVSGGGLVPISSLEEHGITVPSVTPATRDELTWRTNGQVNIVFKTSGQAGGPFTALTDGQAGALVEFTRGNSVLVAYRGLAERRLASQPLLATELVRRHWAGTWPLEWCVVSHLVTAEHATVLIGGDKGSSIELAARAALGSGPVALADLATRMGVARSTGLALELIGENVTPFFRVLRLRRRFMRGVEAQYGDLRELRNAAGRPTDVPTDVLDDAGADPEAALEALPQFGSGDLGRP